MKSSQQKHGDKPEAQPPQALPPPQAPQPAKEPYSKPVLKRLGALKSVAGSLGGIKF
jgi:hypothetical protein